VKQETRLASLSPAQAYQTILVPALFTEWAPRVADAVGIQAGQRVLDVACGTGVLTREIHHRAGPTGHVTGLDLNPDMLAVASTLTHAIEWKKGDAEALPFPDDHFDAAVCHFALMFFNDKVKALSEMLRVIKPGGKIAVIVWDALNNVPAYAKVTELLKTYIGEDAADALRKPFCLGDYDQLVPLFEQAGADNLAISQQIGHACFPDIDTLIDAELEGWMPMNGIVISTSQAQQIRQVAKTLLHEYIDENGQVRFAMSALIVTGNNTLNH